LDEAGLKNLDARRWSELIGRLLRVPGLKTTIEGLSIGFYQKVEPLLEEFDGTTYQDPPTLIWRDPFFYNLLVDESAEGFEVSGVYDFQSAAFGSRQLDFERIRRGFDWQATRPRAKFPEAYADPDNSEAVMVGYDETFSGNADHGLGRSEAELVEDAYEIKYDWESNSRYPLTASRLERFLDKLTSLAS
jgi:hypothetical protein